MENYTLTERARYFPETFNREELVDLMEELELWRANDYGTPEECAAMVNDLEAMVNDLEAGQVSDEQKYDADLVERITFHHDPEVQELWKRICYIVEG